MTIFWRMHPTVPASKDLDSALLKLIIIYNILWMAWGLLDENKLQLFENEGPGVKLVKRVRVLGYNIIFPKREKE